MVSLFTWPTISRTFAKFAKILNLLSAVRDSAESSFYLGPRKVQITGKKSTNTEDKNTVQY